jgi:hypothetical protein
MIIAIAAWLAFTVFAFYKQRKLLASTLLALGLIDLFLIFFVEIGAWGMAIMSILAIAGAIVFKWDTTH